MYCPYCGKDSWKDDVCTECGVVFYMSELISIDTSTNNNLNRDNESLPTYNEYFNDLSPDIEYRHKYSKFAKGMDLNRALKLQKKTRKEKPESFYYKKDYTEIGRICGALRLSNNVRYEALNLRKQVGNLMEKYFRRNNLYKCIACVKLACRIHDFPINERELISLTNGYSGTKNLKGNKYKKIIDREYRELLDITKIRIKRYPKSPNYIPYICNKMGLSPSCEVDIRKQYQLHHKKINKNFGLEGYILAIIYLLYKKEKKIILTDLEGVSGVSRTTITSRVREVKKWGLK